MKSSRRDMLGECNFENEPLSTFTEGWCRRCVNPECTRSLYGQSRFDLRVNSWEDRLFKNPPRMAPDDPRYKVIAGKRFLTIDTGAPPEIRSWVDPMAEAPPQPVPPPPVVVAPVVPPPVEPLPAVEVEVQPQPELQPQAGAQSQVQPRSETPFVGIVNRPEVLSMNVPNQGGVILPGGVKPSPTPVKDPWAAPEPAKNVIPVGGRVKFGGSGV